MPVTLASLPTEIHARIAAMCALQDRRFADAKCAIDTSTFPLAGPASIDNLTTVAALSLVSRYWNKVAEPYRFSRLTASHLASRTFQLGFGRKFGRYISELDMIDLDVFTKVDPVTVLAALPLLSNLHTVMTPDLSEVVEMAARVTEHEDPNADRYGPEVSFVTEAFFELFASVPSLVVDTVIAYSDFFGRLAIKSPQTRQLVLHDSIDAEPEDLVNLDLAAIRLCPRLTELKLVITEELSDRDRLCTFVLPSESCLRHLSLAADGGLTASLFELTGTLSPVLRSLELDYWGGEGFDLAADNGFPEGLHFPQLEALRLTTIFREDLDAFATSISPTAFPVLQRLELRTRSTGDPLQQAAVADLMTVFGPRTPPVQISADSVSVDVAHLRLGDGQLPAINRHSRNRRSLIPPSIVHDPDLSRHHAIYAPMRAIDFWLYKTRAIDPLLARMLDMSDEAYSSHDYVQLRRIAHALQPCELLRIERDS